MTMITRCPACATAFAVTESQLQAAGGNVRCGACLAVFMARDNLVPAQEGGLSASPPVSGDVDFSPPEGAADQWDELDEALAELNAEEATATSRDVTDSSSNEASSFSAVDPAWELLDEDQDEDIAEATPDEAPDDLDDTPGQQDLLLDDQGRPEPQLFSINNLDADNFDDDRPGHFSDANRQALHHVASPVEIEYGQPGALQPGRIAGGIAASAALIALLGLQWLWFNRENLALDDAWRPRVAVMCAVLPCEVAPQQDLAAISSDNLVVRSHPQARNALQVSLSFRNGAPFAQPFPALTLRFTDSNQQPVAGRRFQPHEYLQEELAGMALMPAGASVQATVELVDPGSEAINYEVFLEASGASR